ncbi:hypothetical protein CHUAL_009029 [Chamberlinius hualienensis]
MFESINSELTNINQMNNYHRKVVENSRKFNRVMATRNLSFRQIWAIIWWRRRSETSITTTTAFSSVFPLMLLCFCVNGCGATDSVVTTLSYNGYETTPAAVPFDQQPPSPANVRYLQKQIWQDDSLEETDDENDFSSSLQMLDGAGAINGNGEWSPWTEWSSCSRTCDGGISQRTRRCDSSQGCRGDNNIMYQICNMQPCPEISDFRAQQCAAYNSFKYHGDNYEWEPHYDSQDPCSLTCRAKGHNIIAQLYPTVRDGTRCREGSLDMCIGGKCKPVGCDLQLESTKKVDACGLCGGDGSSCGLPTYYWEETTLSNCTVTCGGGTQISKPVCKNKATGRTVDERLCDVTTRPAPATRKCNVDKCPATWVTEEWGSCSASCGGGYQERKVYCSDSLPNGTVNRVEESRCGFKKPKDRKMCNSEECPRWHETYWSGCSVTCGQGHQTRNVICRDARGHISVACDPSFRPIDKQLCSTGLSCPDKPKEDADSTSAGNYSPLVQPYPPQQPQLLTGIDASLSEPRFVPDSWSPCSVTCGEGIKKRKVHCKIFLEFSRTEAVLPDKECPGKKPHETERCVQMPCSLNRLVSEAQVMNTVDDQSIPDEEDDNEKLGVVVTYSWRQVGFTPCSASCLGGVRESIIQCLRDHDQATVSPFLCDLSKKLDVLTQTCNDQPCPPRWSVSKYSKCSKVCGGGIQTRQVQCVHEVTRGNTLVIPNTLCPEPMPRIEQTCSVWDCRPQWVATPWSKCTKPCGEGVKTRKVECKQMLAISQLVIRHSSKCPTRVPQTKKICNTKPCVDFKLPDISYINQSYVQRTPLKQVSLKVGGKAVIYKGVRLKIKCPVKKFDRAKIQWAKDHIYLESSKRFRISRKGTLKIRSAQYSDSGVYTCIAGNSKANITVIIKPKPSIYGGSGEDATVERPGNSIEQISTSTRPKIKPPSRLPPKLHTIEEDNDDEDEDDEQNKTDVVDAKEEFSHEHSIDNVWPPIPNFSTRVRPKPKTGLSEAKPNTVEMNLKSFDRDGWDYQRIGGSNGGGGGTRLFSDDIDEDNEPTKSKADDNVLPSERTTNGGPPYPNVGGTKSGDSFEHLSSVHALPRIQTLLASIKHTVGNSRGHQTGSHHFISDEADEGDGFADNEMAKSFVLGKGRPENLEFDWMIANWSTCSQTCGGTGFQVRASQCMVRLHNVTKSVDNNLCIDAGLKSPPTIQKCGMSECPRWDSGPWSNCDVSRCSNLNTAIQRRLVRCLLQNGTVINEKSCENETRPREKRECYNDKCIGKWRVGPWSECNAQCGQSGIRSRLLKCVWYGTQRPAGNSCYGQQRPSVVQSCTGPPCEDKL